MRLARIQAQHLSDQERAARQHGVTLVVVLLRPRSHGTVRLASADPAAHPVIDPRYLSDFLRGGSEFGATTLLILVVLWRRDFHSRTLAGLS